MLGKIIGALVGAEIEKRRQESGLKGAVLGAAAVGLAKRLGPVVLIAGAAYAAKKLYDHRRDLEAPIPIAS